MKNEKLTAYVALSGLILFCGYDSWQRQRDIAAIEAHGVEVTAYVDEVVLARGYNLHLRYKYKGITYFNLINTTEFSSEAGDSLHIMILPSKPTGTIKIVSRFSR
ncbi:MAG: hypothetical protein EOO63_10255 [Hymenobacter sp.]|nr:MAG: hypothetical protein EOO63_10255 [Hymenobacter sp.]